MFLKMLESGIAYRKTQIVNWDPAVDQTVLANEQVIDGRVLRWMRGRKARDPGYYLAITKYADELLKDLSTLTGRRMCARCRKAGSARASASISISVHAGRRAKLVRVFTTRPIRSWAYVVAIAAEHPLATRLRGRAVLAAFMQNANAARRRRSTSRRWRRQGADRIFRHASAVGRRGPGLDQ